MTLLLNTYRMVDSFGMEINEEVLEVSSVTCSLSSIEAIKNFQVEKIQFATRD